MKDSHNDKNHCHKHHSHSHSHSHDHNHEKECCPVEMKAEMLKKAFMEAMYQAQVCSMKKKIEAKFADKIDASSDLAIESMFTVYKAKLECAKTKADVMSKLADMMFS